MGPPIRLKMGEVPAYIKQRYGISISRRSIYNWTTKGRKLDALEYKNIQNPDPKHKDAMIKVTTTKWVDEFVARGGIRV